jgi:hypothetical protein
MLCVRLQHYLDYTREPRQCFDVIFGTSTVASWPCLAEVVRGQAGEEVDDADATCNGHIPVSLPKTMTGRRILD